MSLGNELLGDGFKEKSMGDGPNKIPNSSKFSFGTKRAGWRGPNAAH